MPISGHIQLHDILNQDRKQSALKNTINSIFRLSAGHFVFKSLMG